jgi:hypothetical protein
MGGLAGVRRISTPSYSLTFAAYHTNKGIKSKLDQAHLANAVPLIVSPT